MFHEKRYRMPAEWEPQSGVQLTWPHAGTDWAPMLDEITETYRQIASEIAKREALLIVSPPSNDTWARDHGFITLVCDAGGPLDGTRQAHDDAGGPLDGAPKLLDFKFNGWGEKFPATLDNGLNRRIYDEGRVRGEYVGHLDFVLEGGSIESDGQGTIFTTSGCLLAPHRNQPLSQADIEARLKAYLGAKRVVWINHGQLTGDDTDGHIDTLVRICPENTLLYVGCDDPRDEQYEALQLMERELHALRTLDGQPYRLRKLPMPRPIYDADEGEKSGAARQTTDCERDASGAARLPATYANFLVINGAVLVPTYGQPDLDSEAMRIVGEAFPGRDVVGIDCRSVIRQHGSLHCCTMQYPAGVIAEEACASHYPAGVIAQEEQPLQS